MKVKEKFRDTGIFAKMSVYGSFAYMEIIPVETMDMFYLANYGERTLSSFGENNTIDDIAKTLIKMFGNKWNTLYDMAISKIDIDYNYAEKVTENVQDTG